MYKFILAVILCVNSVSGFTAEIIEGQDYELIKKTDLVTSTDNPKPLVMEFFSYGCPWCARLEGPISTWAEKKGQAINFKKVPVVFNASWANYARAYYIVQSLSLDKSVHEALFRAIIVDKQPMNTAQSMVAFFKKYGVEPSAVENAFAHEPSMEMKLRVDEEMMSAYQINAIPTIVVNGMYKTNLQMAKTEAHLFEVLDYLVTKPKT